MSDGPTNPFSDSVMGSSSIGATPGAASANPRPAQVGPYRIIELIGEGGMGEVYKAERLQPMRQTVAIKIIKLGYASREVIGRFEAERQSLAMMDHPSIARVIDAGTTDNGRPYFVMEYVAGKPITQFCDENRLSIQDRLSLFMAVCDAIAHAHAKAIIHRDIKPSNVLAYMHDAKPAVKVIDFGIAKALSGDRLSDQTFYTAHGQAIGTYDSMSPEQAEGSPDIDTRTDVYALGVLLYELLTGAKPFDHATLAMAADAEIKRIIREVEPPRPSTRVSERAASTSDRSLTLPARTLARQLRSELEWIPLKAMRKERARRYASPLQFKEDIENYLSGKPLLAGPETRLYRAKKFVSRNRTGVVTSVTTLLLIIGGVTFYIHNIRAEQERTRIALIESEKQRSEARKQAKIADDSTNFLANIFRNADPTKSLGSQVTVVEVLERTIKELDSGSMKTEPLTEAMVRYVIGTTLRALGRYDEALPQMKLAREMDRKYRSPDDPQIAVTLSDLGLLLQSQGKLAEAEPLIRESLRLSQATLPPDDEAVVQSMANLAMLLKNQQKYPEAETMIKHVLEIRRRVLPANDPEIATTLNNLGSVYWAQGKLAEVEPLVRESLKMRQATLPPGHPNIAQSLMNLGVLLRDQKKYAEAEPLCRQALEMRRKVLPPMHQDIAVTLDNLARVLQAEEKYDEAAPLFREAATIRKASLPAGDPRIADSLYRLATVLTAQGKLDEAEPLYREALVIQRARDPKAAPTTQTIAKLADLLEKTNRASEAAALRAPVPTPVATTVPVTAPTSRPTTAPAANR